MKYQKFSHKTPHLKGKQHQLDPNLDLKQLVHHSTVQYVDRDADGDVDVYDNPKKKTPDENPIDINVGAGSKKLMAKQKGELKHTKRGMAYEDLRKWFGTGGEGGVGGGGWDRYNTKGERIGKCAREPGEGKPKCLSKEKAAKMSKDEIAAAVRRKRKADPVADRPGKGEKPIMSSNKINEQKEKRYCTKCKKMETRDECSYGPEMWDKMTVKGFSEATKKPQPDHEHSMARSELSTIDKAVKRLRSKMKGEGNIEAWVQSKITKAADYIDAAADYLDSGEHNVQGSMDEAKDPCWTGYKQVGMKKKGNKMVPNCVKEEETIEEENKPTNPALWSRAKALAKKKFDVYPSAYANGWASKWYKSKGGGWKSVKEETIEDLNGNTFAEIVDLILPDPIKIEEATRIQSKSGNLMMVILMWRGKTYSLRVFFPQINLPNKKEVEDQIQKVYPGARVLYSKVTEHEPGQPFLYGGGNASKLGPNNNYVKPMGMFGEEVEIDEDWQKVNRQDKTDGLSQKAVDAYRRENPGSNLQTAVTEKNPSGKRADRRKSFCRRMKGMKKRLTSAETARDPDSRINKALRRWNCN